MTPVKSWVVVSLWTSDDNITSWDFEARESEHATIEEARNARATLARTRLYALSDDTDSEPAWCIGLGIAPKPAPGYAATLLDEEDGEEIIWAEYVPAAFEAALERQEATQ